MVTPSLKRSVKIRAMTIIIQKIHIFKRIVVQLNLTKFVFYSCKLTKEVNYQIYVLNKMTLL